MTFLPTTVTFMRALRADVAPGGAAIAPQLVRAILPYVIAVAAYVVAWLIWRCLHQQRRLVRRFSIIDKTSHDFLTRLPYKSRSRQLNVRRQICKNGYQ